MSKLSERAKSSKLSNINGDSLNDEPLKETKKTGSLVKTYKFHPRSYRFDPEIMNVLKSTLDRVNELSSKKLSEAKLIKALIVLSKDMDEMKIIKASKEAW